MFLKLRTIVFVSFLAFLAISTGLKEPVYAQIPTCAYADQLCQVGAVRSIGGELKRCEASPDYSETGWMPCTDCVEGEGQCQAYADVYTWYEKPPEVHEALLDEGLPSLDTWFTAVTNVGANETLRLTKYGKTQTANLTAVLITNPPAGSEDYLAYLKNGVGLAKPVYAQGVGFAGLSPIIELWKIFRNIAYLFFVIIFSVIGLMIILRKRLDPRTVVTIQDSLPRLTIALLLITFSYAIAGLVIDMGVLVTRIIGNVFMDAGLIAVDPNVDIQRSLLNKLFNFNIFKLVGPLRNVNILLDQLGEIDAGIPGGILGTQITGRLVFQLGGFIIMFKIFFTLLASYVEIVLSILLGPLQLMLAALPTNANAPVNWLSKIIANVAVFPVTFTMLAIAAILKSNVFTAGEVWITPNNPTSGFWAAPTLGNYGKVVGELLAYGILFTIPQVANLTKEALSIKEGRFAGAAAQEMKAGIGRLPIIGGAISR